MRSREEFGWQDRADADLETKKQAFANHSGGSGETAPRWNTELALIYERAKQKGNRNRATLAVARKLVAYLMAVDREERPFDTQLRVAGNAA